MKKVISSILGIIFVILVICGVFVGTYIFSTPDHEIGTDSRELILGYWVDEDEDFKLTLGQEGDFTITKASDDKQSIAKGYFKIDEDNNKIKLFILPGDSRDKSVDLGEKLGFFSTITYRNLELGELPEGLDPKLGWTFMDQWMKDALMNQTATVKLIFSDSDLVLDCERTRTIEEFYDGKAK